jgi:glutathione S-transferase
MTDRTLFVYPAQQKLPSLSPPAAKVVLAVARLGIPCKVVSISPEKVKQFSPTGRVPALLDAGVVHVDSVRILDHLEAIPGGRPITPGDPLGRAHDRLWEHLANDHLYWCCVIGRWCVSENVPQTVSGIFPKASAVKRGLVGLVAPRQVGKRTKGQGMGLKPYDEVVEDFRRGCAMIADGLGGGPYLEGRDEPGRGDIAVAALLAQVGWEDATPRLNSALAEHPTLREHAKRTFRACDHEPPAWV